MNIDITNIEALLIEKKYDEVRALMKELLSAKLTDKEKGAALVDYASLYMDISNAINEKYKEALEQAIQGMKEINAAESGVNDSIDLATVRNALNK